MQSLRKILLFTLLSIVILMYSLAFMLLFSDGVKMYRKVQALKQLQQQRGE